MRGASSSALSRRRASRECLHGGGSAWIPRKPPATLRSKPLRATPNSPSRSGSSPITRSCWRSRLGLRISALPGGSPSGQVLFHPPPPFPPFPPSQIPDQDHASGGLNRSQGEAFAPQLLVGHLRHQRRKIR